MGDVDHSTYPIPHLPSSLNLTTAAIKTVQTFSFTSPESQTKTTPTQPLTLDDSRLEEVRSWGGASTSVGWVYRPNTINGIAEVFQLAQREGVTVGFRGGGNSYGDAACNEGNIVLDITRLTRILDWNPQKGTVTVEPGVTLKQLWEYVLEDGWWPPVCTGTMHITIGGGAAMNVHGKNAYKVGTIGDNIIAFDLMLPNGEIISCSQTENSDIFHAAIGGFGMYLYFGNNRDISIKNRDISI